MLETDPLDRELSHDQVSQLLSSVRRTTQPVSAALADVSTEDPSGDVHAICVGTGLEEMGPGLYRGRDPKASHRSIFLSYGEPANDAVIVRPLGWRRGGEDHQALRDLLLGTPSLPSGGYALARLDGRELVVFLEHLDTRRLHVAELEKSLGSAQVSGAEQGPGRREEGQRASDALRSGLTDSIDQFLRARPTGWSRLEREGEGFPAWVRAGSVPVLAYLDAERGTFVLVRALRSFPGFPPVEAMERLLRDNLKLLDGAITLLRDGEQTAIAILHRSCCRDVATVAPHRAVAYLERLRIPWAREGWSASKLLQVLERSRPSTAIGESSTDRPLQLRSLPEKNAHAPRVKLTVDLEARINFAMQQNDVPVVRLVQLENVSSGPLRDVCLRITAEPGFASEWSTKLALVEEGATWEIDDAHLSLSPLYLDELTERVAGLLWFEVSQGDQILLRQSEAVDLLARDEWSGLRSLPEILAAFVLPNHPVVAQVLVDAAEVLGTWTGDSSLSGYQCKNPRRVYTTAAAIYAALQKRGLSYINPPASFEAEGQRIRLPEQILESGMATCLDVAVLSAACLEAAGLHPLLVLVQGHAFTAVWLQDEYFAEPSTDEPLRLRKRVDLDQICAFDPTCVTARPSPDFAQAVQQAKGHLQRIDEFECVIDVQRARKGRIRPIPERSAVKEEPGQGSGANDAATPVPPDLPRLLGDVAQSEQTPETPASRLDRWRKKLLDLSLRNRLLNFRDSKKSIPLLCPDLSELEDALADGAIFHLRPRPHDFGSEDPRDAATHRRQRGDDALESLLREELRAKRLHADLTSEELERRLIEVYRTARTGLEEGGASGLYLGMGFLSWFESTTSEKPRLAPIVMLPLEVHRKSVLEGFTLRLADDEPRVNVTLLEMLAEDHGIRVPGLDPLPQDQSGLDVPKILRIFREAIRDVDRWDVLDAASIGFFSFTKFLMWRDLSERAEDLIKNPIVRHLVNSPEEAFGGGATFPSADRLDEERSPIETFCPLSADSSQLAAVFAAAEGRSFVLEGPPGTGKSQTITNLIAHCLSEGKSVLFVSEKMAALNVVRTRLEAVGLGRYCLELHSNKASKQEVVSQLSVALEGSEDLSSDEWQREARRLEGLRSELNAYVQALHQRHGNGETVFRVTSRLIGLRSAPRVSLRWPTVDSVSAEQLGELRDAVDRLATAGSVCGHLRSHPWRAVRRSEWSSSWEEQVRLAVAQLTTILVELEESIPLLADQFSFPGSRRNLAELALLDELAGAFLQPPAPPPALLLRPDWDEIQARIGAWIQHGRRRDALRSSVYKLHTDRILHLELDALLQTMERAERSWAPASWLRRTRVRRALATVSRDGTPPAKPDLVPLLKRAMELRGEENRLAKAGDAARALLGRYWKDGEPEWDGLERVREWAHQFRLLALRAAGSDLDKATALRERWTRLATEGRQLLARDGPIARQLLSYRRAYEKFSKAKASIDELLELDGEVVWGGADEADALSRAQRTLEGWAGNASALRSWCAWRRAHAAASRAGLGPLIDGFETGQFEGDSLRHVLDRSYYEWWLTAVTDAEPVLKNFFSPEHERKIMQFRETDERYTQLTRAAIIARLAARVPSSSSEPPPSSEEGALKRESQKRRGQMSVRALLQKIPNLLQRLKPCLLMSPMSVAQYLRADSQPFDLVVFDEASQIPVWDAVGAIARGSQAVIVGDPKQLPPTNFFQRTESETEDEGEEAEVVEDLESILDDCMGARIPCLSLKWHYRSRHESLIAFSNHHYYDNRLLTFPAANSDGLGVSWRHVPEGVYDKGKSRTNRGEADAVVGEIIRRLEDAKLSGYSIGVVTFSLTQQRLIEDLLDSARRGKPEIDAFFAEDNDERVFVKNLESVQGDERDVILFSICYGPDAQGRISMNFGAMNRNGGERRLNVAITRARREVVVFSTLRADQIDLSRTRARGSRDLKAFLAYAERGPVAIAETSTQDAEADFDSPFEQAVHDRLVEKGWRVHLQVGCSGYRIDLAVVDPAAAGRYLLGIECDGATYHRAKTARDRDRLREAVLRDLGWEIHRIWSTDWWSDPDREVEKLEAALERAQGALRSSERA